MAYALRRSGTTHGPDRVERGSWKMLVPGICYVSVIVVVDVLLGASLLEAMILAGACAVLDLFWLAVEAL